MSSAFLRPKRSSDGHYDNSITDPDYEDYHFDKSLERQDYFTAVDVVANKLRRQGGNRVLINVPQSNVPDAIINVAAVSLRSPQKSYQHHHLYFCPYILSFQLEKSNQQNFSHSVALNTFLKVL